MRDHHDGPPDHCYGCALRAKGFRLSAKAIPSRQNKIGPATGNPVWENQTMGTTRPDGSFMPYLSDDRSGVIKVKEFGERRHELEGKIRALHNGERTP